MHRAREFNLRTGVVVRWIATVIAILGAWTGPRPAVNAADQPRPHVLLIMSDDLNNSLGCYGQQRMKTPHLDQLAQRGVRCERAYCQFPLCGPSRNSLLCGLYPNSTGILTNGQIFRQTIPQHHSLPHAFRLGGYFAGRSLSLPVISWSVSDKNHKTAKAQRTRSKRKRYETGWK